MRSEVATLVNNWGEAEILRLSSAPPLTRVQRVTAITTSGSLHFLLVWSLMIAASGLEDCAGLHCHLDIAVIAAIGVAIASFILYQTFLLIFLL